MILSPKHVFATLILTQLLSGCSSQQYASDSRMGRANRDQFPVRVRERYDSRPRVQKDETLEPVPTRPTEDGNFKQDESFRRYAFRQIVSAEYRARYDAEQIYSPKLEPVKQKEKATELIRTYKATLIKELHITAQLAAEIEEEGYEKTWPPLEPMRIERQRPRERTPRERNF